MANEIIITSQPRTLYLVKAKTTIQLEERMWERGEVDYDSIDAVNQSSLKEMLKSPRHYEHYLLSQEREESADMLRGTAAHTAIFEPAEFMRAYAMFSGRRAGKVYDDFCAEHKDKTVLTEKDYMLAQRIGRAVHGDAFASRYLRRGHHEVTMTWIDEETGVWCKARLDFISNSMPGWIVDAKTARDVTPHAFSSQSAKLNYHLQAAFYSDGFEKLTGKTPNYMILACEKTEPNDVVPYVLDEGSLGPGREAYRNALVKLKQCRETDVWPGLAAAGPLRLTLPRWMTVEDDDLTDLGLTE